LEDSLVKQQIHETRKALDKWEEELASNQGDLKKFYSRGNKRAGVRVRKSLLELIKQAKLLRTDILRTTQEVALFKDKK